MIGFRESRAFVWTAALVAFMLSGGIAVGVMNLIGVPRAGAFAGILALSVFLIVRSRLTKRMFPPE